jgi:hypothetical protein
MFHPAPEHQSAAFCPRRLRERGFRRCPKDIGVLVELP